MGISNGFNNTSQVLLSATKTSVIFSINSMGFILTVVVFPSFCTLRYGVFLKLSHSMKPALNDISVEPGMGVCQEQATLQQLGSSCTPPLGGLSCEIRPRICSLE